MWSSNGVDDNEAINGSRDGIRVYWVRMNGFNH